MGHVFTKVYGSPATVANVEKFHAEYIPNAFKDEWRKGSYVGRKNYLLYSGDKPVAHALVAIYIPEGESQKRGYLFAVYVPKKYRRKGMATTLMNQVIERSSSPQEHLSSLRL